MATDFTQDSVLYFIRSNGGKVKNSELLFHFKAFVRDNENKTRYRELFKKFVNSVAVVKQEEGVSYVVLRKKFGGQARDISGSRPSATPPGRKPEEPAGEKEPSLRAPETRNQEGTCRYLTKSHLHEGAPCDSNQNTEILPSCGILNDNNNEEKVVSFEQPIQSSSPCAREPERAPPEIPNADEPLPCSATTSKGSTGNVETFEAATATPPELNPKDIHTGGTLGRPKETNPQSNRPPPGSQHAQVSGVVEENRFFEPPGFGQEELPAHARGQRLSLGAVGDDVRRSVSPASSSLTRSEPPSSSCTSDRRAASPPPRALPHPEPACGDGGLAGSPALHTQNPEEEESAAGILDGARQRHSLPPEAEYYPPPTGGTSHPRPHPPPRQGGAGLSSSHGCLLLLSSADSPEWPPERGWSSEEEEEEEGEEPGYAGASGEQGWKVREALRRAQESRMTLSQLHRAERKVATTTTTPWHRSTGHLPDDDERYRSAGRLDNQEPKSPWHRSAGHLRDDRHRDESTDSDPGLSSSLAAAAKASSRPPVRRLHSKLRGRLCRSLGADLDRPPVADDDDPAAARRGRLKLLSSTLSIRYPSSAGSSPSGSLLDLSGGSRHHASPPSRGAAYSPPRQDPAVPLEPVEHDWLVKGASASWTEIYSLFREEPSLLNRRDFVTGYTALHWIAKHGDHRVLNTLGYGVAKAGLRLDVDARTTCGYTPLHLAAIHGHKKMLRLLVYKFRADAALRDTSGKRAWQYLGRDAPQELLAMLGAPQGRRGGGGAADGGGAAVKPVGGGRDSSGGERSGGGGGAGSAAAVKRSTSIAAFLKHHTLLRFPGHQDSVV